MAVEESVIRRMRVSVFLHGLPILVLIAVGYFGFWPARPSIALVLFGVAVLLAIDWWLRASTLTSRRLLVRKGPFGLKRFVVDPNKTGQIEIRQGRFGRALGFGDVIVHPVESEAVLAHLKNVGQPEAMQELIREVRMNSASYVIGF
jgi:membrane protein YdbS with pleckstrin-like domain